MKFSPKPILRAIGSFIRKNDTKILKIAAYGVTAAGAALAVKGGMDAAIEIKEKEAKLKEETQNPEATLPAKEKAKTVIKKVLPGGAVMIGGTVLNEVAFYILNKRVIVATAVGEYVATKSVLNNSAEEQKDGEKQDRRTILTSDKYGNLTLDNTEFELYETISKRTIKRCTINKLIVAEMLLNKELQTFGDFYLDVLIEFLGGDKLDPTKAYRYIWQEMSFAGSDIRLSPMNWVDFKLAYDVEMNRVILTFSKMPDYLEDKLLDKFVS